MLHRSKERAAVPSGSVSLHGARYTNTWRLIFYCPLLISGVDCP